MGPVTLMNARSTWEAELIRTLLETEGILAVVEGTALMDDWAVAGQGLGQVATTVKVREQDLARARAVVEEAHDQDAINDPEPDEPPCSDPSIPQ